MASLRLSPSLAPSFSHTPIFVPPLCVFFFPRYLNLSHGAQLYETLGVRPQYGWQIDPFGSSGVVHGQFAQMGFAGTVTSRIDYLLKGAHSCAIV